MAWLVPYIPLQRGVYSKTYEVRLPQRAATTAVQVGQARRAAEYNRSAQPPKIWFTQGPEHDWDEIHWRKYTDLFQPIIQKHIDGLVQDCSNSSALAMELLQSCTKPSISARLQ